jgi:ubiquitin thioesterase OTU1
MVIYNGVHYDSLAVAEQPKAEQADDVTELNPRSKRGKMIIAAAQKLVALNNKGARYVAGSGNANAVSMRCADCDVVVKGQQEAAAHAQTTGHVNFSHA